MDERLKTLGIILPDVIPPIVDGYVPSLAPLIRSGDQIHLSGRLNKEDGKSLVGGVINLEQGKAAAPGAAVELLAVLKGAGDLDNVRRIVKPSRHGQRRTELHRTSPRCGWGICANCSSVRRVRHLCAQCRQCGAGAIRRVRRNELIAEPATQLGGSI